MQINNNFLTQNFGKVKVPPETPKAIKAIIKKNVIPNIDPVLEARMDYLGYDIHVFPKYYKKINGVEPESIYLYVKDRHNVDSSLPFVSTEDMLPERLGRHIKNWNTIMSNLFGMTRK